VTHLGHELLALLADLALDTKLDVLELLALLAELPDQHEKTERDAPAPP